jgi:LysR family transcriptional regulator, nitrogen assimilation regulatory protein
MSGGSLNIRQMQYFEAVVRYKSLSQAAVKLYVAQPALGAQIRKLEEELGVQLLIRSSRGAEPTECGLILLEKIKGILSEIESTKKLLADHSGPVRGRISIGMTPSIGSVLAVPLLQRCRAQLPNVAINLVEDSGTVLIEWLQSDRLDIALAFSVPATLGLQSKVLLEDTAYLIQPTINNHKAMPGEPVTFLEAICEELILPGPPNRLRQQIEEYARASRVDLKVPFEVQSVSTILKLVEQSFGATIMSRVAIATELLQGRLIARPIRDPVLSYPLSLVRSESSPTSKAHSEIQRIIVELVASKINGVSPAGESELVDQMH